MDSYMSTVIPRPHAIWLSTFEDVLYNLLVLVLARGARCSWYVFHLDLGCLYLATQDDGSPQRHGVCGTACLSQIVSHMTWSDFLVPATILIDV